VQADIAAGKLTFADAANAHSQSPSREDGGDMGWAVHGTRIPKEIADIAFDLPVGKVSDPFISRFGAHLLLVTAEEPGDLSLEDVRDEVLAEIGRTLWAGQLQQERAAAKIERP
jgi:peptidyl-prolyl cis-trans isomerase SurA